MTRVQILTILAIQNPPAMSLLDSDRKDGQQIYLGTKLQHEGMRYDLSTIR
jgi:hypothetical protein